jgi:hypothetical protein
MYSSLLYYKGILIKGEREMLRVKSVGNRGLVISIIGSLSITLNRFYLTLK